MNNEINENWECFLCTKEFNFEILPKAYISNSHPLCEICADSVLEDQNHKHRFRLTYHSKTGDIEMVANIPVQGGYSKLN